MFPFCSSPTGSVKDAGNPRHQGQLSEEPQTPLSDHGHHTLLVDTLICHIHHKIYICINDTYINCDRNGKYICIYMYMNVYNLYEYK